MCDILFWRKSDHQGRVTSVLPRCVIISSCVCVCVCVRSPQLRDDFDMGADVQLDEEHSVHDVAALLKEFLRDMPDPLLPRELYPAFLHANCEHGRTHRLDTWHLCNVHLCMYRITTHFFSVRLAVLRGAEQLQYLQHLLYLLPPCNCDTLLRLLSLLHTVHSYAQDSIGTNDEEVGSGCIHISADRCLELKVNTIQYC